MPPSLLTALGVLAAYLLGSISFALVASRLFGLADPRSYGSKNPGATNVLRSGHKGAAIFTLLGDAAKGWLAVFLASHYSRQYGLPDYTPGLVALAVFFGHLYPIFLGFKGGKGVATGLGALFGWSWILGLVFIASWIGTFLALRISSASALTAVLIVTIIAATGVADSADGIFRLVWPAALLAVVIWIMHRANIARLLKGQEPKSSFSKKP